MCKANEELPMDYTEETPYDLQGVTMEEKQLLLFPDKTLPKSSLEEGNVCQS